HGLDMGKVQVCEDQLSGPDGTFAREDAQGGCATTNDAATIEMKVDAFVDAIVAAEPTAATCAIAECPAPLACDTMAGACWQPPLQTRPPYQRQAAHPPSGDCDFAASGGIDTSISAVPFIGGAPVSPEVYDIDFLTDPVCAAGGSNDVDNTAGVNAIHTAGAKAICYVDAGTDEPFRPDHQDYVDFDTACGGCLFGKPVAGFREERWLNINDDRGQRTFILGKVDARIDRCKVDGFDAVEFDNVEAYPNPTGLPISEATQLLFNTALANLAHAKGLTVGLKNDVAQVAEVLPYFDFAINEQCQEFNECATLDPFVGAGKPVFQVEYQAGAGTVCPAANGANRNAILKSVDLFDTPWTPCRRNGALVGPGAGCPVPPSLLCRAPRVLCPWHVLVPSCRGARRPPARRPPARRPACPPRSRPRASEGDDGSRPVLRRARVPQPRDLHLRAAPRPQ